MTNQNAEQALVPIARAYGTDARWLRVRTANYFGTLDFSGKTVLDVGAGSGLYACCVAALGAARLVALEPELEGATSNAIATFRQRIANLDLRNVEVHPLMAQDYDAPAASFDLIYMLAVINHLDETHVRMLHNSEESRAIYRDLLRPLWNWLKPGGTLIITDASCHHAYKPLIRLGILKHHPLHPHMEWEKHQPPKIWRALLEEMGFAAVRFHWATNQRYPWMPRFLVDNVVAAHFNTSQFVLRGQRPV